jgi:predicted amidohydrolase
MIIQHDNREGLDGWFEKTYTVVGGDWMRFHALRKLAQVASPRRSALVRIVWLDSNNKLVPGIASAEQIRELGHTPSAEPEHPIDGPTDIEGWTTISGTYQVPPRATKAKIELHLQWAPGGSVEYRAIEFTRSAPPPLRIVRLASIHHRPAGLSPRKNCEEFEPLLAKAAEARADLVVLGETIPSVNVKQQPHEVAELIPGPTTEYFGQLAEKHSLHIVLSLYERDQHLVYNTAVLLGPTGQLIGKYRKVCLPHGEVEKGIAPGNDFPTFDTSIGKVGMMVCYDGFFPEVARQLTNNGAEIIAWPVWGCNPKLAMARACENHVYLVSSTFMAPKDNWMISAIYDPSGKPLASANDWGELVVAEVDLNQPYRGPYNLGDFRSMIPRHRPLLPPELPISKN